VSPFPSIQGELFPSLKPTSFVGSPCYLCKGTGMFPWFPLLCCQGLVACHHHHHHHHHDVIGCPGANLHKNPWAIGPTSNGREYLASPSPFPFPLYEQVTMLT